MVASMLTAAVASPTTNDTNRMRAETAAALLLAGPLVVGSFETTNRWRHDTWESMLWDGPYTSVMFLMFVVVAAAHVAALAWAITIPLSRYWPQANTLTSWAAVGITVAWSVVVVAGIGPGAVGAVAAGGVTYAAVRGVKHSLRLVAVAGAAAVGAGLAGLTTAAFF